MLIIRIRTMKDTKPFRPETVTPKWKEVWFKLSTMRSLWNPKVFLDQLNLLKLQLFQSRQITSKFIRQISPESYKDKKPPSRIPIKILQCLNNSLNPLWKPHPNFNKPHLNLKDCLICQTSLSKELRKLSRKFFRNQSKSRPPRKYNHSKAILSKVVANSPNFNSILSVQSKSNKAISLETSTRGTTETFCNSKSFRFTVEDCPEVFHNRTITSRTKRKLSMYTVKISRSLNPSLARLVPLLCPQSNLPLIMGYLINISFSLCRSVSPSSLYRDLIIWATKLPMLTSCRKCPHNSGHRVTKCSPSSLLEASIHRLSSRFSKLQINWLLTKVSRLKKISLDLQSLKHKHHNRFKNNSSSVPTCRRSTTCNPPTEDW